MFSAEHNLFQNKSFGDGSIMPQNEANRHCRSGFKHADLYITHIIHKHVLYAGFIIYNLVLMQEFGISNSPTVSRYEWIPLIFDENPVRHLWNILSLRRTKQISQGTMQDCLTSMTGGMQTVLGSQRRIHEVLRQDNVMLDSTNVTSLYCLL